MVEGTVEHTNPVTLKIYFSGAISGKAHLS